MKDALDRAREPLGKQALQEDEQERAEEQQEKEALALLEGLERRESDFRDDHAKTEAKTVNGPRATEPAAA